MPPVKYHKGKFPPCKGELNSDQLLNYLSPAYINLLNYNGFLQTFPNANVLLSPLRSNEAVLSSKIEGTRATLSDILNYEAGEIPTDEATRNELNEVINYRVAMMNAQEELENGLPFCQRLLKNAHNTLLKDVRGEDKAPGKYRTSPVYIGNLNDTVETAKFIPIDAPNILNAMTKWEKFANIDNETCLDPLIKLAILHVEFESIHPFNDGNGRIGRMLIPLFLFYKKIISAPTFYISAYFEKHREEYYDRLRNVSRNNDWTGWCCFFLKAISEQAKENYDRALKIRELYDEKIKIVSELTHSHLNIDIVNFIFSKPIFRMSEINNYINASASSIRGYIKSLIESDTIILVNKGKGRKSSLYLFPELFNIIK
jgi:Fic family protein